MIRSPAIFTVLLALLGSHGYAAEVDNPTNVDLKRLQGKWTPQSYHQDGQRRDPTEQELQSPIEFVGKELHHNDTKIPITVDAGSNPKLIDFDLTENPDVNAVFEGIYKLEGDQLTICIHISMGVKSRPTEFTTTEGSNLIVVQLRRQSGR